MNAQLRQWNILIGICLLAMAAFAAYDLLVPKPSSAVKRASRHKMEIEVMQETGKLKTREAESVAIIEQNTWVEEANLIGPQVLDQVASTAKAQDVQMSAFRPQRSSTDGKVERIPFLITLQGSFPKIVAFVRNIEAAGNRIGVTTVQCASADGKSDAVTATVGLIAVRDLSQKKPPIETPKVTVNPETKPVTSEEKKKGA